MMTTDDKRRLESILARRGLSRKVRSKAVGAVDEWLGTLAAQPKNVKAETTGKEFKELMAAIRQTKEMLVESKGEGK